MKDSKKIRLTISTTAGDLEDTFPANMPLHAIQTSAMGKLKLDPSQADKFDLTLDGTPLDRSKTLSELGLRDGAVLVLERKEVVKI